MKTAFDNFNSDVSRTNTNINVSNTSGSILTNDTGLGIVQQGYEQIGSEANKVSDELNNLTSALQGIGIDNYSRDLDDIKQKLNTLQNDMSVNANGQSFGQVYEQLNNSAMQVQQMHEQLRQLSENFKNNVGRDVEDVARRSEDCIKNITESLNQISPSIDSTKQKLLDFAGTNERLVSEALARTNDAITGALASESNYIKERAKTTEEVGKFNERINDIRENIDDTIDEMLQEISQQANSVKNVGETIKTLTDMMSQYSGTTLYSELNSLTDEIRSLSDNSAIDKTNAYADRYQNTLIKVVEAQKATEDGNVEFYKNTTEMVRKLQSSLSDVVSKQIEAVQRELHNNGYMANDLEQKEQALKSLAESMTQTSEQKLNELLSIQREKIQQAVNMNMARQQSVSVWGSDENLAVRNQIANQNLSGISYGAFAGNIDNALMSLDYSAGNNSPWYQYVTTGNVLGNKTALAANMRDTQRHGYVAQSYMPQVLNAINNPSFSEEEKATAIGNLAGANSALTQSLLTTAGGMNLSTGGAKNLSQADKQVYQSFQNQVNLALANLTKSIRAIEELDPNNTTLNQLKKEQAELLKLKNTADKAKNSSSALADVFGVIHSGVNKLKNVLAGGLGLLGLGALLNPMQMLSKGMDYETEEGKRRYNIARTDFYMGASLNNSRIIDIARNKSNEYWRMTNGMIGDNEYADYYSTMAHSVGGHYGASNESAASDMAEIADKTFGIAKRYDIGSSTVASVMKTFYKDLGMSASEAGQVLVDLAQTANSANVPVEKLVQTVASMADAMRNQGVSGNQVKATMLRLLSRKNMRIEDAQSLMQSQVSANESMAKDMNASAFFGMMAGEGGSPIDIINAGYMGWDSSGRPKEDYYATMANRVMAEANMMATIGGGNTALGQINLMDSLMGRGYSRKDASMIADAASKGDESLVKDLIMKADERKDGGKQSLSEAMVEAKEQLAKAGEQVSMFQKLDTDMAEAQKHLGQAINQYLSEPLKLFREGFASALNSIVDLATKFAKSLNEFIEGGGLSSNSTIGGIANWVSENPLATLAGGAGVAALSGLALTRGKAALASRIMSSPSIGRIAGGASKAGAYGGVLLAGAGVLGGGAFALANLVKMFSDGTATVTVKPEGSDALDSAMSISQQLGNMNENPSQSSPPPPPETVTMGNWTETKMQGESLEDRVANLNDSYESSGLKAEVDNWKDTSRETYLANVSGNDDGRFNMETSSGTIGGMLVGGYKAFKNGGMAGLGKAFGSVSDGFKTIGKGGVIGSVLFNGINEYLEEQKHPDRFTFGEHAARVGIQSGASLIGTTVGGALGSMVLPGVGTAAGMALGGLAGDWLGGKVINSAIGDYFGISDNAGKANENRKYEARIQQSANLYGDASKSIVSSNDERTKAAGDMLSKHGLKLEQLSASQETYMNNLFYELRAMGLSEQVAAIVAGAKTGEVAQKQANDADFAFEHDNVSTGQAMLDISRNIMFGYGNDGQNPNYDDLINHPLAALYYAGGAGFKGTLDKDDREQFAQVLERADNGTELDHLVKLYHSNKEFRNIINRINSDNGKTINNRSDEGIRLAIANGYRFANDSQMGVINDSVGAMVKMLDPNLVKQQMGSNLAPANAKSDAMDVLKTSLPETTNPTLAQTHSRQQILDFARSKVGGTYSQGAQGGMNWDCSGLVQGAYASAGLGLERTADVQYDQMKAAGGIFTDQSQAKIGDTVFMRGSDPGSNGVGHVGIVSGRDENGNLQIVEAASSATGIVERNLYDYHDDIVGFGDASVVGATGGASGSVNFGNDQPTDPVSATQQAISNAQAMMGQIGDFAKLQNKELLRDRVATGQLVLDGVSALSANRTTMSLRGVRDSFRLNSGVHDTDLYGVGVHGAFSGTGEMLSNTGAMDMEKQIDGKLKISGSRSALHSYGSDFGDTSQAQKNLDDIAEQYTDNYKKQREIYEKQKENQEKAKEDFERNLDSATINVFGVENHSGGLDEKSNSRIARLESKSDKLEERLEYVGETVNQLSKM